jgi:hypothetical protein
MRVKSLPIAICIILACSVSAGRADVDRIFCPPSWLPHLIYAHSFDAEAPELNAANLRQGGKIILRPGGLRGSGGRVEQRADLLLAAGSDELSAHRPLTVMFWWSLAEDLPPQGGFNLIQLSARRGYISSFARGGPWCGLEDTAAVMQAWSIPGIRDENNIYDTRLRQTLGLTKGRWHHAAMVINGGSQVSIYTDGRPVFEMRLQGRRLTAEDGFSQLRLGGGLLMDELLILRTPLEADQIAEYVTAMRQIRAAYFD